MSEQTDLFGRKPEQASLFGDGDDRMKAPKRGEMPDPEAVRRRLHRLLAEARAATQMPWPERHARMWQTVFPNMANWLPSEEADQLRLDFGREMERLRSAA